ncbi:MAG: hypothetical protein IKO88_04825 [Bacteroidales bacterium]|nr:hypothetical protein [Bacteroidales bacterium]
MKAVLNILIISTLGALLALSCSGKIHRQGKSQSAEPTKTVFTYDGGEIVLTDEPHIATVNGVSGNWSYIPDEGKRNRPPQPYYYIYYGNNQTAIVSEGKGMIYFGTEDEAVRDERKISKWHEYRKYRE